MSEFQMGKDRDKTLHDLCESYGYDGGHAVFAVMVERDEQATMLVAAQSELDATNGRLSKIETAGREMVALIRDGANGRGNRIVSRPCSSGSCRGSVCGPVAAFWGNVEAFSALLGNGAGS